MVVWFGVLFVIWGLMLVVDFCLISCAFWFAVIRCLVWLIYVAVWCDYCFWTYWFNRLPMFV